MAREAAAEGRASGALWFGLLAAPAAWSIQVVVGGELPEFGCAPGGGPPEIYGVGIEVILRVTTALLALVAVAGGIVAFRCWRRTRGGKGPTGERASWMALSGVMTSAVFFVIIVLGFAPTWYLSGCGRSL